MGNRGIYVEIHVQAPMDQVWNLSQDPAQHSRWDLRFSSITPTTPTVDGAMRFTYTRRTPLRTVAGDGISIGEHRRRDGTRTSALRFATTDRLSPIRSGRGYWRYVPTDTGVRFLTGYDYEPGWGRLLDRLVRPLLGWATAWSFDRLRIWAERGEAPEEWPIHSVLWFWRPDRPRARECLRAPRGGRRRDDHLRAAPRTLAALRNPEGDHS
ncbi:SRPBCC family protein [Ruania halotolerans]|uniref:SRPBCC family protein n=1 Tax=Ruania halotolerans TaxID=2897773 RepID=UPI001E5E2F15|nr:SRPBCC family protein [Ruania halotolerans]UFU05593.1 SRPBCC family protein [Ruania halotolerans]